MTTPLRRRRPAQLPEAPPPAPHHVGFVWRDHRVAWRPEGRCRHCGRPAFMTNENGDPEHKVCAEGAAVRDWGLKRVEADIARWFELHKKAMREGAR